MRSHRDGKQVVICDGCYRPIISNSPYPSGCSGAGHTDGREGDVHNQACANLFQAQRPVIDTRRQEPHVEATEAPAGETPAPQPPTPSTPPPPPSASPSGCRHAQLESFGTGRWRCVSCSTLVNPRLRAEPEFVLKAQVEAFNVSEATSICIDPALVETISVTAEEVIAREDPGRWLAL